MPTKEEEQLEEVFGFQPPPLDVSDKWRLISGMAKDEGGLPKVWWLRPGVPMPLGLWETTGIEQTVAAGGSTNFPEWGVEMAGSGAPSVTPEPAPDISGILDDTIEGLEGGDMASVWDRMLGAEPFGPEAQYQAGLGLGGGYQNPAQRYLARLYEPLRDVWQLQQPIQAARGGEATGWQNYLAQMGVGNWPTQTFSPTGGQGGMGAIATQAGGTLGALLGMTPGLRQEMGLSFEPTYDPVTGELVTTAQGGGLGQGNLAALMELGLRGRFGPIGARWLGSRLPQMTQTWGQAQQPVVAAGGAGMSFLDWLRERFKL